MAGTQSSTEDEIIEQTIRITASIFTEVCGVLLLNDKGTTAYSASILHWAKYRKLEKQLPCHIGNYRKAVTTGRAVRIDKITNDPSYIEITPE